MSGRKQFDEEKALDAAMRAFWRRGYEATSMADLEVATGLNKSSLYNAFASKEALFERCLAQYGERYSRDMVDALAAPTFRDAVAGFFDAMLARFESLDTPQSCLVTMAELGVTERDGPVARALENGVHGLREKLASRCRTAQAAGEIGPDHDASALADLLLSVARGIAVLDGTVVRRDAPRQAVSGLLATLDALAPSAKTETRAGQRDQISTP